MDFFGRDDCAMSIGLEGNYKGGKDPPIHPFIFTSIHPFIFTSIHPYIAFSRRDASLKGCRDEHRIPCKNFEQLTRSTTHLG